MTTPLTVAELFQVVNLSPRGPVMWKNQIEESNPGIYVVSLLADLNGFSNLPSADYLPRADRDRWVDNQPIVYIGRTRRALAKRMREFYRHIYGKTAPHRGGQAVKLLTCELWVFWAPTDRPVAIERDMIEAFRNQTHRLPFANRRREGRLRTPIV